MAEETQKPGFTSKELTMMARERARGGRMAYISMFFNTIEALTDDPVDDKVLEDLRIVVEKLDVTGDNTTASTTTRFFEPFSRSKLEETPFSSQPDHDRRLEMHDRIFAKISQNGDDSAYFLSHDLMCRATIIPRAGAKRNQDLPSGNYNRIPALAQIQGWEYTEHIGDDLLHDAYRDTIMGSWDFTPMNTWEWHDPEEKPHVMLTLAHGMIPGERFLSGELLSILAIMRSRLGFLRFYKHLIIPIMLFSFIGCRGRIIQAQFDADKDGFVLLKSDLFDFSNQETAIDNMNHFVRHVASAPIGDTEEDYNVTLSDESDSDDSESSRGSVDGFEVLSSDVSSIPDPVRRGWFS